MVGPAMWHITAYVYIICCEVVIKIFLGRHLSRSDCYLPRGGCNCHRSIMQSAEVDVPFFPNCAVRIVFVVDCQGPCSLHHSYCTSRLAALYLIVFVEVEVHQHYELKDAVIQLPDLAVCYPEFMLDYEPERAPVSRVKSPTPVALTDAERLKLVHITLPSSFPIFIDGESSVLVIIIITVKTHSA